MLFIAPEYKQAKPGMLIETEEKEKSGSNGKSTSTFPCFQGFNLILIHLVKQERSRAGYAGHV
jgi:hypothetical protein